MVEYANFRPEYIGEALAKMVPEPEPVEQNSPRLITLNSGKLDRQGKIAAVKAKLAKQKKIIRKRTFVYEKKKKTPKVDVAITVFPIVSSRPDITPIGSKALVQFLECISEFVDNSRNFLPSYFKYSLDTEPLALATQIGGRTIAYRYPGITSLHDLHRGLTNIEKASEGSVNLLMEEVDVWPKRVLDHTLPAINISDQGYALKLPIALVPKERSYEYTDFYKMQSHMGPIMYAEWNLSMDGLSTRTVSI